SAFNEAHSIKKTLIELQPHARKHGWKILIIDDGSTDQTNAILAKIGDISVIRHPYNKGYGASLKTGIKNSQTPLVAFFDADGQHRPDDLEKLVAHMADYDMVVGKRGQNSHEEWIRKPGKLLLSAVANYLTEQKIPDLNSGMRVVRKRMILGHLHLFPEGFSFSTTSTIAFLNLGYNVGYVTITAGKRIGKSTVKQIKHGTSAILLIIRLILLFNPLKFFLPLSIGLFIVGSIYEILYGIILFQEGVELIPAAFFTILTSLLIFFFGLVVDQLSELRKHTIDRTHNNSD
ncbi:MAG: glycosyltransferase family 2 protein, partial [Deltaproteobacteria bacterium]|nr:glycosyltransferase family 2 protein [Deltaproteobacteria bacterium]